MKEIEELRKENKELYLEMKEYPNKIRVSNFGNVQFSSNGVWVSKKLRTTTNGYLKFNRKSYVNGVKVNNTYLVHREVAKLFLQPNDSGQLQVNHKNGIKSDNRVENLEWVTAKQNNDHAVTTGLKASPIGSSNHRSILSEESVKHIYYRAKFLKEKASDLAKEYGVSKNTIFDVVSKRSWNHVWIKYAI